MDQSPPPARLAGWAKGVPRLPRLGFPPWNPPSEAPPPIKRNPQGGTPIPATPGNGCLAALGADVALGEDRATHGSGSPFGSRPLQSTPPVFPSAPSRGLPASLAFGATKGGAILPVRHFFINERLRPSLQLLKGLELGKRPRLSPGFT